MADFSERSEGFEFYCAIVKFLPAFLWILKLEVYAVLARVNGCSPPEGLVWNV